MEKDLQGLWARDCKWEQAFLDWIQNTARAAQEKLCQDILMAEQNGYIMTQATLCHIMTQEGVALPTDFVTLDEISSFFF